MQQLGKALTILAVQRAKEDAIHLDVDAMGAPGECHDAVSRNSAKRRRQARKHAESVARLPWRLLVGKLGPQRLSSKAFLRLESICLYKATGGQYGG
jgi:hypothetical protein